ncbi:MAG: hypothetical protein BIFFINMI_03714 [Phycisphaerae bacterium]|nr:hypothetical protein [Phycisphaerae bacterium]
MKFTYLDGRDLGQWRTVEKKKGEPIFWAGWTYPDDLYSPVVLMHNDRFAIGMSLIYDVLAERHDVRGVTYSEGGTWFGTAGMGFDLHVDGAARVPGDRPMLEPGRTAAYRVAVRFAAPADRLDTLAPYRDYFRKRFGEVKYTADRRPVFGETTSLVKFIGDDNPRGYSPTQRIDRAGWKPFVDEMFTRAVANGYCRVMIWAPSGLYRVGDNYPCEFMTEWPAKLVESIDQLRRFERAGVTMGMWWGRSGQVGEGWDSGRMHIRDIRNAKDVEAGWAELRLAADRGVDEVGLDASMLMGVWDRVEWLRQAQRRFPGMNLITEASECDIGHTLAPTFMTYQRQGEAPVLADWLNPGHESWIMLRWQEVNQKNFDRIAGWGCVPVTMSLPVRHDAESFKHPTTQAAEQ